MRDRLEKLANTRYNSAMEMGVSYPVKKKVLFCATVDSHIKAFHLPFLNWFRERGYAVHIASSGTEKFLCDAKYDVCFSRNPFHPGNLKAYCQLRKILAENRYEIIHFHTPVSSFIGRLAARKTRRQGTKVLYTAHGFHFFAGAPLKNRLLYYPLEKWMAKYTDALLVINEEDYQTATARHFKAQSIEKLDGMGVDLKKFRPFTEAQKRDARGARGYRDTDFLLICAGEFNKNKNQIFLIEAVDFLRARIPDVRLLLAGRGQLEDKLKAAVQEKGLHEHVFFLGFRDDLNEILPICDVGVSASGREGLPVSIIEAIACGLPAVVTDIRGHRDIIQNGKNGFLYRAGDFAAFQRHILEIHETRAAHDCAQYANSVARFSMDHAIERHAGIYRRYMEGQ